MPEKQADFSFSLLLSHFGTNGQTKSDYICSVVSSFSRLEDLQTSAVHEEASIWTINNTTTESNSYKYGSGVAIM